MEMVNNNSRPGIKYKLQNIYDYDKIILGFPVWWYKEPTIIDTFIEENNLENKKVYIFVTSLGSTVDGSLENLRKKYNTIKFLDGKRFKSKITRNEILDWIK